MSKDIKVLINEEWCKGCEICVEVCPRHILKMRDFIAVVEDEENCTGCMLCEQLCPDFAIKINTPEKQKKSA